MRRLALAAGFLLLAGGVCGQDLGDAAARERAKRGKKAVEGAPAARVFTNADLPKEERPAAEGAQSESTAVSPPPTSSPSSAREKGSGPGSEAPAAGGAAQPEEGPPEEHGSVVDEWRDRAAEVAKPLRAAKQRLKEVEERIAELRERLNPMSTKYVFGAGGGQDPNEVFAVQGELGKAETEREEARESLAEAQRGWDEFVARARADGAPASLLREPEP